MFKDLDLRQMAEEQNACSPPSSPDEVEQLVVFARMEQHNRAAPCGAAALHRYLRDFYHLRPLPSVRTIGRILARHEMIERR